MENTNETYVLKMDNIAKEYYGNRVLKGVNLHIRPGEISCSDGRERSRKIHTDEYPVWDACDS